MQSYAECRIGTNDYRIVRGHREFVIEICDWTGTDPIWQHDPEGRGFDDVGEAREELERVGEFEGREVRWTEVAR